MGGPVTRAAPTAVTKQQHLRFERHVTAMLPWHPGRYTQSTGVCSSPQPHRHVEAHRQDVWTTLRWRMMTAPVAHRRF
jgi:hypothetical protein